MQPEFELNHLKYFYFTVLEGGVASAAERLHVQQPVVSKMLRSLDERFQQPLFRKSGRRKVLTDFGQLVYRHCQIAFQELEKLGDISSGSRQLAGPLNLGCSEAIAGEALAKGLQSLLGDFPDLHPNVYSAPARHLVDLLAQRKLEFGLFFHLPELPSNLEVIQRWPLRFHLVVARSSKDNVDVIERFIGSREIDDTHTHKFPTLEKMRRQYKGARIALSSNNLNFHRQLVRQGFGSSILPAYLVAEDLKNRTLHDIYPREKFSFDLKIVAPKSETLSRAAQELLSRLTF